MCLTVLCRPAWASEECIAQIICIDTDEWRIAAAVGAGTRTNPLRGANPQTLLLIGDVAWYSDSFYLDNLEFGYQWQTDDPDITLDSYFSLDREARLFFSYDGFDVAPADVMSNEQLVQLPVLDPEQKVNIDDIADRKNGRMIGLRIHVNESSEEWQLAVEREVGNVHSGTRLRLSYRYGTRWGDWGVGITPQLVWTDRKFNSYYYGVNYRDTADGRLWYHAGSGFRPGVNITASKPITPHWGFLWFARYQYLPRAITRSPLLDGNDIITVFAGLTYQF